MARALVTGATAGLGHAFARRLAADGHDLVVVARDAERLGRLAATLQQDHGVTAEVLPADLGDHDDLLHVEARLADAERPVDLLVNNAGYTLNEAFLDHPVDVEDQFLDVMVRAVMRLSHAAAAPMRSRERGAIVNVSSVAGFTARGTYSAHKAWVTAFSQGLALELAGSGVHVMALCPGLVHTEFHDRAGMDLEATPELLWLDADEVVDEALRDVRRGRDVSIPDLRYKTMVAVARHLPLRIASAVTTKATRLGRR